MGALPSSFGKGYVDEFVFPERCPGQLVPAINGGFTLIGIILSTFAATFTQWINPTGAAAVVIAQVLGANIYIFTVLGRWAFAVGGGVQQWHARHAFLVAGGSVVPLVATTLAEAHQIHGFESDVAYHEFVRIFWQGTAEEKANHGHWSREGDGAIRRLWFLQRRHKALFTSIFFSLSLASWIVVYICISISKSFWQTNCHELIDKHASPVLMAYSVVLMSAAFGVAVGFWIWTALHYARWRGPINKPPRRRRGTTLSPGASVFRRALSFTRGYDWIRYGIPTFLFLTWFAAIALTTENAYRYFLTVNGTAFYYSCVQNLFLGVGSVVGLGFVLNKHGFTYKQRRERELAQMLRSELVIVAEELNVEVMRSAHDGISVPKNRRDLINEILAADMARARQEAKGNVQGPVARTPTDHTTSTHLEVSLPGSSLDMTPSR
ncbi:hypothetical protein OIV83_004712 [Microbotryomycetes sp. JL201]|nr:hypothetical protein OIV83_004712 [Microbotryomycetes sp. JL201]